MKRFTPVLAAMAVVTLAAPAQATGGLVCRTVGPKPIELSIGFGHAAGSALILTRLIDSGRIVPVLAAQWWLDNQEVRLLLTDPNAVKRELLLGAKRNGHTYDGSIWRSGKRRWVRCREDG